MTVKEHFPHSRAIAHLLALLGPNHFSSSSFFYFPSSTFPTIWAEPENVSVDERCFSGLRTEMATLLLQLLLGCCHLGSPGWDDVVGGAGLRRLIQNETPDDSPLPPSPWPTSSRSTHSFSKRRPPSMPRAKRRVKSIRRVRAEGNPIFVKQ